MKIERKENKPETTRAEYVDAGEVVKYDGNIYLLMTGQCNSDPHKLTTVDIESGEIFYLCDDEYVTRVKSAKVVIED